MPSESLRTELPFPASIESDGIRRIESDDDGLSPSVALSSLDDRAEPPNPSGIGIAFRGIEAIAPPRFFAFGKFAFAPSILISSALADCRAIGGASVRKASEEDRLPKAPASATPSSAARDTEPPIDD